MFASESCSKIGCFLEAALPAIAPAVALDLDAFDRRLLMLGDVRSLRRTRTRACLASLPQVLS